jgi:hypothetical protein
LTQENNLYEYEIVGEDSDFDLTWPHLHVSAHVSYMKHDNSQETKGEVTFISERPTSSGHLRSGRLNLTSPSSRKTFSKWLSDRDDQVDWDQVIEQLCVGVLKKFRVGEPVVELTGKDDVEATQRWLVDPLINLGHPTVLYAPGATGKSYFAQYIAVLVDAGLSHNNLHVEPANVLYLDWETDAREIGARVTMLRRGLGLDGDSHIKYRAMTRPGAGLANDVQQIKKICVEHDIGFVVVDSVGLACMGEPESAQVVNDMFQALRSLKVSSLCIDHTNKANNSANSENLFGSVYKYTSARQIFEGKKSQHQNENKIELGLFHKKSNNDKLIKDLGFTIEFSEENSLRKVFIRKQDIRNTDLEENMRVPARIENLLRRQSGGLSVPQICEELEKSDNHIRKELSKGKNRGMFTILPNGNWANQAWVDELQEEVEGWKAGTEVI